MNEGNTLAAPLGANRYDCWTAAGILALLSALCCAPLMNAGWFASHEEIRPIARALAAYYEIADGDLYPRWLSTGYLGKGVPLFNFYSPAFSLAVAYAHALGVPLLLAAKLTIYLLFLAGSWGAYLWVRPHLGHYPALVAGILYLFAPYHFVNLYVRGATAEFTSLAALPYLFLGIDRMMGRFSARGLASLALASAAIVLSHFLSALMIAPFAAAYALARAVSTGGGWGALGRTVAGGLLGAALSAFYWLPALAERDALSSERAQRAIEGYNSFFHHFVRPIQWIDPTWGFGASFPDGYPDEMSFQVGLLILASAGASALLVRRMGKEVRRFVVLTLGLGVSALLLTSAASRLWYSSLPPYRLVQFPWRYLGPVAVFFAAAGGGFVRVLADRLRWVGPGMVVAAAALALAFSAEQRSVSAPIPVPDVRAAIERVVAADGWSAKFGNEDEYLPKEATVEGANAEVGGPIPVGLGVEFGSVRASRTDLTFEVTAPAGQGIVVIPWHVFPGWEVSLDGRDWQFVPGYDGLITFLVPQGSHVARVRFGTTLPRIVGWSLALVGLVSLGALALRERLAAKRGSVVS